MTKLPVRRRVRIALLAAAGVASLVWGGYQWRLRTPPPMPDTVEQAIETFKGERFARLPETRQQAYYDRARELFEKLDGDRRRALRDEFRDDEAAHEVVRRAMLSMITQQARDFTTAEANQQQVILDGVIAMQELGARRERRRAAERGNDSDRQRRREERLHDARERIQNWVEQGNPQRQAYLSEFFKALRERRIERGLPPEPDFSGR